MELIAEVYICLAFLSYIVNNDPSGLSDNDIQLIEDYCNNYPGCYFIIIENSEGFCRDIISGLMADTMLVHIYKGYNA